MSIVLRNRGKVLLNSRSWLCVCAFTYPFYAQWIHYRANPQRIHLFVIFSSEIVPTYERPDRPLTEFRRSSIKPFDQFIRVLCIASAFRLLTT